MNAFVQSVNRLRSNVLQTIKSDELLDNLNTFMTIQDASLKKTDDELETIIQRYVMENEWLTPKCLQSACTYYINLLINTHMFSNMDLECKRVFYAFCRQNGYLDRLSSSLGDSIYYSHQVTKLQKQIESMQQASLPEDALYSFNQTYALFLAFSISPQLIGWQAEAIALQQRLCSCSASNTLQQYIIEISQQMRDDSTELTVVVVALILTYIPAITVDHIPVEAELPAPSEDHSIRYVLWKLLETYFSNLQWNKTEGCFEMSDFYLTNLFAVPPCLLYLSCIVNASFMKAFLPYITEYTLFCFETKAIVQDELILCFWSCLLRFHRTAIQTSLIQHVLQSIQSKASSMAAEHMARFFKCIL